VTWKKTTWYWTGCSRKSVSTGDFEFAIMVSVFSHGQNTGLFAEKAVNKSK